MTGSLAAPRTVHVEHCMGTVFTVDIRDAGRTERLTTKGAVATTAGEAVADIFNTIVSRGTAAPKAQEG